VALIIGNGDYAKVSKLPNATRDAEAMAALFRNADFDVVEDKRDLGLAALRRALRDFTDHVRDADIAVVSFAGHGIEVNGTNYLIPVDATLERDIDVEDEAVSLERVTQILEQAKRLRLVILDACRDNPFVRSMKRTVANRSIGRGLAEVRVLTADTLIAFAAKAGSTASDGEGTNSPYTLALGKHLGTPGLDIRLALGRVRDEVLEGTRGKQEPFVYGSLGGAEISLVGAKSRTQATPEVKAPMPLSEAAEAWDRIKDSSNIAVLEAFILRFKETFYADMVRTRVDELKNRQAALAQSPTAPKDAPNAPLAPQARPAQSLRSAADVLERIMPAIVSIEVKTSPKQSPKESKSSSGEGVQTGQASGFTISANGLVVTSYAAVTSAESITVRLADGTRQDARLIGAHAATDLALLEIKRHGTYPFLAFSKRNVSVGERVLVAGNPYGLDGSARTLQVSGWQKLGVLFESIELSPGLVKGEGGAPLVDMAGTVVGVNYAFRSGTDSANSVGYAIPANVAAEVIDQLQRSAAINDEAALTRATGKSRELSREPAIDLSLEVPQNLSRLAREAVVSLNVQIADKPEVKGSGMLVSADGYVLTANHVVDAAKTITVKHSDGRSFEAKLIGKDPRTDIALLKVSSADRLPFLNFARHPQRKGDIVFALEGTDTTSAVVASGIVSSLARDIGAGPYDDYIQTDVATDGHDAGSPLLTLDGEVAGMRAAIYSGSGKFEGIAFAVPANILRDVSSQLQTQGVVERGWLGVKIQNIDEAMAAALGISETTGALIAKVETPSPAADAGLVAGDVILSVNGNKVLDSRGLARQTAGYAAKAKVDIRILRGLKEQTLAVTLGRLPVPAESITAEPANANAALPRVKADEQSASKLSQLGLTVAPGVGIAKGKVVITKVEGDSDAAQKGVKSGDVVLEVGGMKMTKPTDVADAIKEAGKLGRGAVLVRVQSGSETHFVAVQLRRP
jgi:S1-C subfamily serine protease